MLVNLNRSNSFVEELIGNHYEFRKNLLNKFQNKDLLEYKRKDGKQWSPVNIFPKREKRHLMRLQSGSLNQQLIGIAPDWLLQKTAEKFGESSEEYVENPEYLKLVNTPPVYLTKERPISPNKRSSVVLNEGDRCFVCLGMKRTFFGKKFQALPGIIEAVHSDKFNTYYHVFLVNIDPKKDKVRYHGRHMVYDTELGRTPEESVHNIANSQVVY